MNDTETIAYLDGMLARCLREQPAFRRRLVEYPSVSMRERRLWGAGWANADRALTRGPDSLFAIDFDD